MCLLRGGVCSRGDGIPACTEADPPVNRMTNRCKNVTLPQTSFAGGKKPHFYTNISEYRVLIKTAGSKNPQKVKNCWRDKSESTPYSLHKSTSLIVVVLCCTKLRVGELDVDFNKCSWQNCIVRNLNCFRFMFVSLQSGSACE